VRRGSDHVVDFLDVNTFSGPQGRRKAEEILGSPPGETDRSPAIAPTTAPRRRKRAELGAERSEE